MTKNRKSGLSFRAIHKWGSFVILFITMQLCPHFIWGQSFIYGDLGVGNQGDDNVAFVNFELGGGYVLFNNFNCFGGIKLDKYYLDVEVEEDSDFDETNALFTANLFIGAANYFKIAAFDEDATFKSFGFFPEVRFFFNPLLPRKISYEDNGMLYKRTGGWKVQTSIGYGGGVYFKTSSGLIALKFEWNLNDPFEVLRGMEYGEADMPFSKGNQLLISLRFSGF